MMHLVRGFLRNPVARRVTSVIRNRLLRTGDRYDEQTIEILRRVGGNCLDVGCYKGWILKEMLAASPNGRHAGFEPIPHLAARLRTEFPSAQIHEVALSEAVGETTFTHVKSNPAYSGLRRQEYPTASETEELKVRLETIDNLIDYPVDFIKVDVEGAELAVFRGARMLIDKYKPVIVFEHGRAAKAYPGSSAELHDLLAGCGLGIYLLPAWLKGGPPLSREGFIDQGRNGPNWYFVASTPSSRSRHARV